MKSRVDYKLGDSPGTAGRLSHNLLVLSEVNTSVCACLFSTDSELAAHWEFNDEG